jgi:hypothetical protein
MRLSLRFTLVAAFLTPAALFADTPSTTQWIVTSAKATGRNGENYVSSLRIVNPNAVAAPVDLTFLPFSTDGSGDNGTSLARVSVVVNAHSSLAINDVLATFPATGSGGILVQSTGGVPVPVWALSQTLVTNALSHTGVAGTNGFAIPSQTTDQLIAAGETGYVPYVSASASPTSGYRTNVFLLSANTSGNTDVTVALVKSDGTVLGTRDITLARRAQTQINDIANSFGYTPGGTGVDTTLTATVTVKSGGPVATGASVIDNAIASVSYSPPMKVAVANNAAYGVLLNDGNFDFSGRIDLRNGNGDFISMSIVVPNCGGLGVNYNYVFPFQAFGSSFGTGTTNTSFVPNTDGTISFSGAQADASFNGTIFSAVDGSVYGTVNYTRAAGSSGAPCQGMSIPAPYTFTGTKAFSLTP